MKVGDLVRVKSGAFMQGRMGIVVKYSPDAMAQGGWFVQLIGNNIPTALKHRPCLYRPIRLTLIKSSGDRDQ